MLPESDVLSEEALDSRTGVTLITGAAMGIGRAFAEAFAARGDRLLLVDMRAEALPALANQLLEAGAAEVFPLSQDLAVKSGPRLIFNYCRENHLTVSTLVNNAAVGLFAPFADQQSWRIEEMIRLNVLSPVLLTRLFLPEMIRRRSGTIVNLTSISAFESSPTWSVYGATKGFVQNFTESLQDELKGIGIYVTAVCPGVTRTNFFNAAGTECPEDVQPPEDVVSEALAGMAKRLPLIVTGRCNRIRIHAQRANLRRLIGGIKARLRRVGVVS